MICQNQKRVLLQMTISNRGVIADVTEHFGAIVIFGQTKKVLGQTGGVMCYSEKTEEEGVIAISPFYILLYTPSVLCLVHEFFRN